MRKSKVINARFKAGSRVKADPMETHLFFKSIEDAQGNLDIDTIIAKSKPKRAVLHGEFEWHDPTAAIEHRRTQAKCVVRHLEVTLDDHPDINVKAYESVKIEHVENEGPARQYRSIVNVIKTQDGKQDLVQDAIEYLGKFMHKYAVVIELTGHRDKVTPLINQIEIILEEHRNSI